MLVHQTDVFSEFPRSLLVGLVAGSSVDFASGLAYITTDSHARHARNYVAVVEGLTSREVEVLGQVCDERIGVGLVAALLLLLLALLGLLVGLSALVFLAALGLLTLDFSLARFAFVLLIRLHVVGIRAGVGARARAGVVVGVDLITLCSACVWAGCVGLLVGS